MFSPTVNTQKRVATPSASTRRAWWTHISIAAIAAVALGSAIAQTGARELLNSERIAAKFGSYGVEVLSASEDLRVSNLFSTTDGTRVCRSFAVVRYPHSIDPALVAEHALILEGGSIGAVFAAHGWEVRKTHLYYGEIKATASLAKLMGIAAGARLAEHVYVLDVAKDGRAFEYAALVEIHHPAYLRLADLDRIYGPANPGGREQLVATLLATAAGQSAF
jgi:hypothetical protein